MYEHISQGHYGKILCKNGTFIYSKGKTYEACQRSKNLEGKKKSILRSSRSSYASETRRQNRLEPSNQTNLKRLPDLPKAHRVTQFPT